MTETELTEAELNEAEARGDSYRNRALALVQHVRRWRGETRKATGYLTDGWVRTVEYASAADERADRAEAELRAARARVAALESGAEAVERVRHVLQVWLHDQRPYITDEVAQLISEITAALTAPTVVAAAAAVDTGGGGEGE